MIKIDISIVVICYNQENIIAETLESIKYQLETYKTQDKIQLIIADDASKDKTTHVVEKWIGDNRYLFEDVCLLFAKENRGTTGNLLGAVRKATGKYLITIAGDDLFSSADVIKKYKNNPANGIVACVPYCFKNGKVITDETYYRDTITTFFFNSKYIKKRSQYACPVINGGIIGRDFFCDDALSFSENVKVLDDQARFMKAMELLETIVYSYETEPVLLYRISSEQVTQKKEYHKVVLDDKRWLAEYARKNTRNLGVKIIIFCEYMRLKNRKLYKAWLRFFNFDQYYVKIINWVFRKKIKENMQNIFNEEKVRNVNEYVNMIQINAKGYSEEKS